MSQPIRMYRYHYRYLLEITSVIFYHLSISLRCSLNSQKSWVFLLLSTENKRQNLSSYQVKRKSIRRADLIFLITNLTTYHILQSVSSFYASIVQKTGSYSRKVGIFKSNSEKHKTNFKKQYALLPIKQVWTTERKT